MLLINDPLSRPFAYQACHDILRAVHSLVGSKLLLVPVSNNVAAFEIAYSVTRDHRLQLYVARSGPRWLNSLIMREATLSMCDLILSFWRFWSSCTNLSCLCLVFPTVWVFFFLGLFVSILFLYPQVLYLRYII